MNGVTTAASFLTFRWIIIAGIIIAIPVGIIFLLRLLKNFRRNDEDYYDED